MTSRDIDATIRVFIEKFSVIADEFGSNDREIANANAFIASKQERQVQLRAEVEQLRAAGQLLGFDIFEESAKGPQPDRHADAAPQATAASLASTLPARSFRIKDWVLNAAQEAYPNPVRAADLRRAIWRLGHEVHEKTVGMTLYRLSQTIPPLVTRRGKLDWYYIPTPEETEEGGS